MWRWPEEEFLRTQLDQEQEIILNAPINLMGDVRYKRILEPGSGTARISFHLYRAGVEVTLCDLSENAVQGAMLRFGSRKKYRVIRADLRNLPFHDDAFDLVWNAGVMEHFSPDELDMGLREMRRVSRKYVAVFVPFDGCVPYKVAKLISEAEGTWEWGRETPRRRLRIEFTTAGLDVIDEYVLGRRTNIPLSYLRLMPKHIAEEFARDFQTRRHFYQGVSLATIGVKRGNR